MRRGTLDLARPVLPGCTSNPLATVDQDNLGRMVSIFGQGPRCSALWHDPRSLNA